MPQSGLPPKSHRSPTHRRYRPIANRAILPKEEANPTSEGPSKMHDFLLALCCVSMVLAPYYVSFSDTKLDAVEEECIRKNVRCPKATGDGCRWIRWPIWWTWS